MQQNEIKRVIIQNVRPQIRKGKFPVKRVPGEEVIVTAEIFTDGQDAISANLLAREGEEGPWKAIPMVHTGNDEWKAGFIIEKEVEHDYTVEAWIDRFKGWLRDFKKKSDAGVEDAVDLLSGALLVDKSIPLASGSEQEQLRVARSVLADKRKSFARRKQTAFDPELELLMERYPHKENLAEYERVLKVATERGKALFSSWYEVFPRSAGKKPGGHGTFRDLEKMLPYISGMGFDVLYLPPIHPIGKTNRKGKNNAVVCQRSDPGSPWAIGSAKGGHKSVHPQLGTLKSFQELIQAARKHGLEVAMDLAFQCSPDHPYVKEHPEWFRWRPDGTVQYAENPPKKYEDILPLNFETKKWRMLWEELKSIVLFWMEQGVRIFRVDNPHTKPFAFWQWLLAEIKSKYPEVIFLSEAFTRPKVMQRLAKIGFDQSYTYFTWRNTKYELEQYLTELIHTDVGQYLRPNLWPNTPDILPQYLQFGGRPAFITRLVLAATLSASYGIYGPAFELCVSEGIQDKEEYLDAEKYEIKNWDRQGAGNIRAIIERVNQIRKENPALQSTRNLRFCPIDNDMLLSYYKATDDLSNITVMVVNLDPYHSQSGWIRLPLSQLGVDPNQPYLAHDLISDDKYIWQGETNYVKLDPRVMPACILRIRGKLRRETDFDYFM